MRRIRCGIDAANRRCRNYMRRNFGILECHEHASLISATRTAAGKYHTNARSKSRRLSRRCNLRAEILAQTVQLCQGRGTAYFVKVWKHATGKAYPSLRPKSNRNGAAPYGCATALLA